MQSNQKRKRKEKVAIFFLSLSVSLDNDAICIRRWLKLNQEKKRKMCRSETSFPNIITKVDNSSMVSSSQPALVTKSSFLTKLWSKLLIPTVMMTMWDTNGGNVLGNVTRTDIICELESLQFVHQNKLQKHKS